MFVTVKKCGGQGECIKSCPTEAIRYIDNRSFSCICCGACFDACPNHAIFKNKYGGYVVDRAKCNGCGICESVCPVDSIHIEDGLVKGICSRCGLCEEACPDQARIDAFDVVEDKQKKIINNLKAVTAMIGTGAGAARIQAMDIPSKQEKTASRNVFIVEDAAITVQLEPSRLKWKRKATAQDVISVMMSVLARL